MRAHPARERPRRQTLRVHLEERPWVGQPGQHVVEQAVEPAVIKTSVVGETVRCKEGEDCDHHAGFLTINRSDRSGCC